MVWLTELKGDFASFVKVAANKENSTNNFRSTSVSNCLLVGMQVTPRQTHFIFCPKEAASGVGDRRAFPPACQAGQAARTSSQSDSFAFPFLTSTIEKKKIMQVSTFIFRSSSGKIVREKGSGVHSFLSQLMSTEFTFFCLEDLHKTMQVLCEQQLALCRSLLKSKERSTSLTTLSHF